MDKVISLELAIKALTGWETDPTDEEIEYTLRKLATDKNVGTNDTINRQQAIDAVTDELDMIDHVPQWVFDRLEKRLKQLPPAQLSTDCISRQAAIDAILHITNCKSVRELFEYNQLHHLTEMWSGGVNDAIDAVIGVDSTQLGTNLAEVGTDTISRKQAIDALKQQADTMSEWSERYAEQRKGVLTAVNIVEDLPSAQPKIIRCKDCNHFYKDNLNQWCFLGKYGVKEDDFCSRAERKTNEQFN